ncbi:HNH endonuclease [Achromobacter spanius]|uniref:HNH endonuclease n=1 Tax=Achromobacter spanius TaxID=217203 RepID=UPI0037F68818
MWPTDVRERALSACGRRCCICNRFCGVNMELHHIEPEADGGPSTLDNCIPLCFDCHADVGHYNDRHPKGTKYRPSELRRHRDAWFLAMAGTERLNHVPRGQKPALPDEIYDGQRIQFKGYLSRQTFAGPPNYEDFRTDALETNWLLTLPEPFRFNYRSFEPTQTEPIVKPDVQVLHLMMSSDQYEANKDKLNGDVYVTGKVTPCVTGHHRGDALLEVEDIHGADLYLEPPPIAETIAEKGDGDVLILPTTKTPRNLINFLDLGTPKAKVLEVLGTPDRIQCVLEMKYDRVCYRYENTQVEIGFEDGTVAEVTILLVAGKTWQFDIDGLHHPMTFGRLTLADVLTINPEARLEFSPGNHANQLSVGLPFGPSGGWDMHWFGAIQACSKAGRLQHVDFAWDFSTRELKTRTDRVLVNWIAKTRLSASVPLSGWHIR